MLPPMTKITTIAQLVKLGAKAKWKGKTAKERKAIMEEVRNCRKTSVKKKASK